jgi:hypothetical protein
VDVKAGGKVDVADISVAVGVRELSEDVARRPLFFNADTTKATAMIQISRISGIEIHK